MHGATHHPSHLPGEATIWLRTISEAEAAGRPSAEAVGAHPGYPVTNHLIMAQFDGIEQFILPDICRITLHVWLQTVNELRNPALDSHGIQPFDRDPAPLGKAC